MMRIFVLVLAIISSLCTSAQAVHRTLPAKRTALPIKIDGILDDAAWKDAPAALDYTEFRPTPFKKEDSAIRTECYMLYNDEGIFISGFCHERTKDSIAAELVGRDGFGTNDYIGVIFDTYNDKINGFEYFVTPYGEQWDAKMSPNSNGNSEDFSWNAVWKSAAVIRNDGWTFEMFIPFSAIRFSKKNIQDWGLNITRRRRKTEQQVTWNPIDVNVNGFLTQEGYWTGLENIKPPLRLQFSPYLSYYVNHFPYNQKEAKNWTSSVNGGMDLKYGINQAITLDMTLIPDFGQVQSDNQILNITPFEVKYNEKRPFFVEGTELFNKGNFFYSRRIGGNPIHHDDVGSWIKNTGEHIVKNPTESKLLNATKISGRTQSGLGIGFLNAVTNAEYATVEDSLGHERKIQTSSLTNYNIFVLDQSLKHNSSITFINNSVIRGGTDYDADVTAGLFDLYDKSNTWNLSGKVAMSNLFDYQAAGKTLTGYGHYISFGKSSGRFNFNVQQELTNNKFNNNDLGYITNNNYHNYSAYAGYHWTTPSSWYNNLYLNFNFNYSRRLQPDTYQNANINANVNGQLKNLWQVGTVFGYEPTPNNFYEPHRAGRVFRGWSDWFNVDWIQTNFSKRYAVYAEVMYVSRSMFNSKRYSLTLQQNFRFNKKFSIGYNLNLAPQTDNVGFATIDDSTNNIIFGRRDISTVENIFNVKYSFNNKMVFTGRVRHYWSKLYYKELFNLQQDGSIEKNSTYKGDVNPDYNDFTVDAVFTWEFAPGSFINAVWKNNTNNFINSRYGTPDNENYFSNFNRTMNSPQNNNFSIKVIYFLDYLQLKNKKKQVK